MMQPLPGAWLVGALAALAAGSFAASLASLPREGPLARVLGLMQAADASRMPGPGAHAAGRGPRPRRLAARAQSILRPLLPDGALTASAAALRRAGMEHVAPEEVYAAKLCCGLLAPAIALLLPWGGGVLSGAAMLAGVAAYGLPDWYVARRAARRARRIERELLPFLGLVATFCEAGLSLGEAVARIAAAHEGVMAAEFRRAVRESAAHLTRREAWQALIDRSPSPELDQAVDAIRQAEEQGVSIARAVRQLALSLEHQRQMRVQEIAQQRQARMFLPLMLLLGAVLLITIGPLLLETNGMLF